MPTNKESDYNKVNITVEARQSSDVNVGFSAYCMYEFETALHHWITKKRTRRVIVLMALDRPNDLYASDDSDTAVLRHYLRQYTYIDYTADDWLDKLIYALPLHGMIQKQ